jgi:putative ABC transport system permease protein
MFRNYLLIAWRNLLRYRTFTAINISGLAIGLATFLAILLYVTDELSYDRFHEKSDRIVRVVFEGTTDGGTINDAHVMPPVAPTLKATFPEVQEATRFRPGGNIRLVRDGQTLQDQSLAYVDSNFFRVFTLPFVSGDPATALLRPHSIVLSQKVAKDWFGATDPVGKTVLFKGWDTPMQVTGVLKDIPEHSHFQSDVLGSMADIADARSGSWMTSEYFTYLVLPEGYNYKKLEAKLPQVVAKHLGPQLEQAFHMSYAEFQKKGNRLGLYLQPLTDIHLHSHYGYDLSPAGDIRYVYIFSAIAVFMLLIACINFMNLSTASAARRAREVGIRKVLGSDRKELVRQFLFESLLLTGIALVLAALLVDLGLPLFRELSGKNLKFPLFTSPGSLAWLLGAGLLAGLLAGGYPALYLSSFQPVTVLKGRFSGKRGGLRSGLVVFQFFISGTLMICTLVVYRQLTFIQDKKLGYDREQVVVLPDTWALGNKENSYLNALRQDSRIVSVSRSGFLPAGPSGNNNFFLSPDQNPSQLVKTLRYEVDPAYIPTLGLQLAAGRNFSDAYRTDSSAVIVNETAARTFGWKGSALGHTVTNYPNNGERITLRVVGVVRDFHFRSLHEAISPLVMVLSRNSGPFILKLRAGDPTGVIERARAEWKALGIDQPFTYSFLNDRFTATYHAEQQTGLILAIFAGMTIFVASLGLFGLAAFTAQQRTKEIGVRKVLGASVTGIVGLLSRDFLRLVGIGFLVAVPLAWYVMSRWLEGFAYRTQVDVWVVASAGLLSLVIALATVGYESVRAALANPAKSLKSE